MVYARNYGVGQTWSPGVIIGVDGPVSFVVKLEDGRIWRRHLDQLMRKCDMYLHPVAGHAADVAEGEQSSFGTAGGYSCE